MHCAAFSIERERLAVVASELGRALHAKAGGGWRITRWATAEHIDAADLQEVGRRLELIARVERAQVERIEAGLAQQHAAAS